MNSYMLSSPMASFSSISDIIPLIPLLFVFILPYLGGFILKITAKWNILEKAGEPGWAALVPFYGNYLFYDITWNNGWFFLGSYVPGVNYVFHVITMVKLSGRFAKNSVFTLGLVLFEPIFLAILGFDDSEFVD